MANSKRNAPPGVTQPDIMPHYSPRTVVDTTNPSRPGPLVRGLALEISVQLAKTPPGACLTTTPFAVPHF